LIFTENTARAIELRWPMRRASRNGRRGRTHDRGTNSSQSLLKVVVVAQLLPINLHRYTHPVGLIVGLDFHLAIAPQKCFGHIFPPDAAPCEQHTFTLAAPTEELLKIMDSSDHYL